MRSNTAGSPRAKKAANVENDVDINTILRVYDEIKRSAMSGDLTPDEHDNLFLVHSFITAERILHGKITDHFC